MLMVIVDNIRLGKNNEITAPVMIINLANRSIVSIPTQLGCNINCDFCISSLTDFVRNFSTEEMILLAEHGLSRAKSTNVMLSFTGEGEPILNLRKVNDVIAHYDFDPIVSSFRICTSGIKPSSIKNITTGNTPVHLQLSLHSAIDETRMKMIPKTRPVQEIKDAVIACPSKFAEVAVNYVLMDGVNDSESDIKALIKLVDSNWIIKLNPLLGDNKFSPSKRTDDVSRILSKADVNHVVFTAVGSTIKNNFYEKLVHEKHNAILVA